MIRQRHPATIRVAVDTGGTFTDCVWIERGELQTLKVFSTPDDPSAAIEAAVRKAVGSHPFILLHGTTIGTNALIERKGARIALITTAGFEDAIEIGRQARPKLYDFLADRPAPLVSSDMRFGAQERISAEGVVLEPLTGEESKQVVDRVRAVSPQAIAISLLFSFVNPAHERKLALACAPLGVPLSVSHQLLPEFREYERTSTVVMNAYLQPMMAQYLERLERRLDKSRTFVMQSSGGIAPLTAVAREPVRTVLSGPAGGVVGARAMSLASGFDKAIAFDMGGTSTDVSLIAGTLRTTNEGEIIGLPVRIPMLDIHTVGAGGGSIARFDAAGALRVGPDSAGVDPGPICYGRGTEPTVTDANLLLGRLRADKFLGGKFALDMDRTKKIVSHWLRRRGSRWSVEEFSAGVVRVVNVSMERAIRAASIEKGYDPREFTLVAFGGAGPLHACELARSLDIPRVLVPQVAGALSAYGILVSDVVKEFSRTVMLLADPSWGVNVRTAWEELKRSAIDSFDAEGWDSGKVKMICSLDLRYLGQGFELNVPYSGRLRVAVLAFHEEHKRQYGYADVQGKVEVVNVRVRALLLSKARILRARANVASKREREAVYFQKGWHEAALIARESIGTRQMLKGPAIITEYTATTVVPPGFSAELDATGNLILSVRKAARANKKALHLERQI